MARENDADPTRRISPVYETHTPKLAHSYFQIFFVLKKNLSEEEEWKVMEWEEVLVSSWEPESSSHPGSSTNQQVIIIHFSNQ